MSIVEGFERKALFNITRAVALFCVTVFLVMIVGGLVYGVSIWQDRIDTKVPAQEIVDPLKVTNVKPGEVADPTGAQPPTRQGPEESALAGYKIPFSLQKYISGENGKIVRGQLDGVPEAERQAYIDELGAVVTAAEAQKVPAIDAINSYMQVKSDRYKAAAAKSLQKWETLKIVAEVTAAGLLLVALFSLVLVLLAIERNTRSLRQSHTKSTTTPAGEREASTV
ncbi:hypothetical protein [Burkholderia stabilis]|uniref:hypothetical protein n=1 Tax=Burkholderia stabilis TaxID=95485 RepID=UPI000A8B3ADA|nr:hypothetical protein [Burkholderia stabilis]HDR9490420.1 hypothetical protein [Burkholderia stabilis]HDR9521507.1 hypothetical protein [Burkholderia stabilis]HDR9532021.1 hypothetical protein [Burkholderia stabilis]HDR9537525.1 hypothetical protein [Burkholderia stabilis]HDR9549172.1 hypothetical protein [Burkholderia stabilis]